MSTQAKKKHVPPLAPRGLTMQAEYARRHAHVKVPHGIALEEVMAPSWWQHHVAMLKVNDRLEVVAEDGSFWVELGVVDKGIGFIKMRLLWKAPEYQENKSVDQAHLQGVFVKWGGRAKWRILKDTPKGPEVVRTGFHTKEDAQKAALDYLEKAA